MAGLFSTISASWLRKAPGKKFKVRNPNFKCCTCHAVFPCHNAGADLPVQVVNTTGSFVKLPKWRWAKRVKMRLWKMLIIWLL